MYEKYLELIDHLHLSTYRVSQETGIPQATFSKWKKGEYKPKYEVIKRLAEYFGCSTDYFYGNENENDKDVIISLESREIAEIYMSLSNDQREKLLSYARFLLKEGD